MIPMPTSSRTVKGVNTGSAPGVGGNLPLKAVDLGDSSLSEAEAFELTSGLSASIDSEPNEHTADDQLELDVVANEMDQMQISQSEISLRAREKFRKLTSQKSLYGLDKFH